jgi:hypothetical protein
VGFAGFTTFTTNGAMGGRTAAHALCNAEFAGSHLCHATEYIAANSAATVPATGAWIDSSVGYSDGSVTWSGGPITGRGTAYSCINWTSSSSGVNTSVVYPSGGVGADSTPYCASVRPLACCGS